MESDELFTQKLKELLTNYYENMKNEKYDRFSKALSRASDLIKLVDKSITINVDQLKIIKKGKKVYIIYDNNLYFLFRLTSNTIFCPRTDINQILQDFYEIENNE